MRIAIIGAGIAGLTAAGVLKAAGHQPVIFDKGRGPGGRSVSKRTDHGGIDLGLPYFTARDPAFRQTVDQWIEAGVVAPWSVEPRVLPEQQPARPQARLVAVPRMSALARHLAEGLDLHCSVQVSEITRELTGWVLRERQGESLGEFDGLILTAPAPQSQSLLAEPCPRLAARAATARMQPCWALGLVLEAPLELGFDAGFPSSGPLGWIARSGSRPERPHLPEIWLLHATAAWSEANIEWSQDAVGEWLTQAFADLINRHPVVTERFVHRWRFARARDALKAEGGYLESEDILCAGDWVSDGTLEGAWQSGRAAAHRLLSRVGAASPVDG